MVVWPIAIPRFLRTVCVLTTAAYVLCVCGLAQAGYWWSVPQQIDHGDNPGLTAVSCPSRSLCVAVDATGAIITSSRPSTGPWKRIIVPGAAAFNGVACPSESLCIAVDQAGDVVSSSDPS